MTCSVLSTYMALIGMTLEVLTKHGINWYDLEY